MLQHVRLSSYDELQGSAWQRRQVWFQHLTQVLELEAVDLEDLLQFVIAQDLALVVLVLESVEFDVQPY